MKCLSRDCVILVNRAFNKMTSENHIKFTGLLIDFEIPYLIETF